MIKDNFAIEKQKQEDFIKDRALGFVGREQELEQLQNYLAENQTKPLIITGEAGIGKSAFLARFTQIVRQTSPVPFPSDTRKRIPEQSDIGILVLPYFVGASPQSVESIWLLKFICYQLEQDQGAKQTLLSLETEALLEQCSAILQKAGKIGKVVLLIDALNQLIEPHITQLISLFHPLTTNIYAIVSSLEGPITKAFRDLQWPQLSLPRLAKEESKVILNNALGKQEISETSWNIFLAKQYMGNPLYLKVASQEILEQENINLQIKQLPGSITEVFQLLLERLEQKHDKKEFAIVSHALGFMAIARCALYEDEICELLEKELKTFPIKDKLQKLFEDLRPYLLFISINNNQCIDFFHEQLKFACSKRYASIILHQKLSSYLGSKGFSYQRTLAEYSYHLHQSKQKDQLHQLLMEDAFSEAQISTFGNYQKTYETIRHGIKSWQNGTSAKDDQKLCQLALRSGKIAIKAHSDIRQAFENAKIGDIEKSLKQLAILKETDFYYAVILLLWIEAKRQGHLAKEQQTTIKARQIVAELNKRVPQKVGTVWSEYFTESFMVFWGHKVSSILEVEEIAKIFIRDTHGGIALIKLGVKFIQTGQTQYITTLFRYIEQITDNKGVYPTDRVDEDAVEKFIKALVEIKDLTTTFELLVIAKPKSRGWGLFHLCEALADLSTTENVQSQLMHALELTLAVKKVPMGYAPKVESLYHITRGFINLGEKNQAQQVWQEYQKATDMPTDNMFELLTASKDLSPDAIEQTINNTPPNQKKWGLFRAAATLVKAGRKQQAFEILEQIIKMQFSQTEEDAHHISQQISQIAKLLIQIGKKQQACEFVHQSLENLTSLDFFSKVDLLIAVQDYCKALQTITQITCRGTKKEAFFCVMRALLANKTLINKEILEQAIQTVHTMEYNLEKMDYYTEKIESLAHIASILAHENQYQRIFELFTEFPEANINENKLEILRMVILRLPKSNTAKEQQAKLFHEAMQAAIKAKKWYKGIDISRIIIALIETEVADKEAILQQAFEAVKTLEKTEEQSQVLSTIAQVFSHIGKKEKAIQILQQALENKQNLDFDENMVDILLAITKSLVQIDFQKALQMVPKIHKEEQKYEALKAIIRHQFLTEHKYSSHLQQMQEIARPLKKYQCHILSQIADILVQEKEIEQAFLLFEKSLKLVSQMENKRDALERTVLFIKRTQIPNAITLLQQALISAKSIGQLFDRCWTMQEIIKSMAQIGHFSEALEAAETVEDFGIKVQTYAKVIVCLTKAGKKQEAQKIQQKVLDNVLSHNFSEGRHKDSVLKDIIATFDHTKIIEMAAKIDNDYYRSLLFSETSNVLTQENRFKEALELVYYCGPFEKFDPLLSLINAIAQSGDYHYALELVDDFKNIVQNDKSKLYSKYSHEVPMDDLTDELEGDIVQQALEKIGSEILKQTNDFSRVLKLTQRMKSGYYKDNLTCDLVAAMAPTDVKRALEIAQTIEGYPEKTCALAKVVAYSKSEQAKTIFSQALEIAQQIDFDYYNTSILVTLIESLVCSKNLENRDVLLLKTLNLVKMVPDNDLFQVLEGMAEELAISGEFAILRDFLNQTLLPAQSVKTVLMAWQKTAVEHMDNPLEILRETIALSPFDYTLMYHGVSMLQMAHFVQGNKEHCKQIELIKENS